MAAVTTRQTKRWTYEDYHKVEGDQRYEIIAGELLMAPAPDIRHQDWSRELMLILATHAKRHALGKVFAAPIDMVLDSQNTVQPDLVFVSTAKLAIIQECAIVGAP